MNAITASLLAETALVSPAHPDADLIRLCAEHIENMRNYNEHGGLLPLDEPDPLWESYERTRNAITAARPRSLEGMLAVARAAKAEAKALDDSDVPEGTPAANWAWRLVDALLDGHTSPPPTEQLDADLIQACAAFDAIEAKRDALYARGNPAYIADDDARDEADGPLCLEQEPWVKKISETRANTCAGVFAKIRSIALWDKEILKPGGGDVGEVLLASACRDVLAGVS